MGEKKISLFALLTVILLIALIVFGVCIYHINHNKGETNTEIASKDTIENVEAFPKIVPRKTTNNEKTNTKIDSKNNNNNKETNTEIAPRSTTDNSENTTEIASENTTDTDDQLEYYPDLDMYISELYKTKYPDGEDGEEFEKYIVTDGDHSFIKDEILIGFYDNADRLRCEQIIKEINGRILEEDIEYGSYRIQAERDFKDYESFISYCSKIVDEYDEIKYAEPNGIASVDI